MIKIPQARIWKTGKGYVVTIPKAFIEGELLKEGKRYDVVVQDGKANKVAVKPLADAGMWKLGIVRLLNGGNLPNFSKILQPFSSKVFIPFGNCLPKGCLNYG